jgi:hypothetical protein
MPTDETRPSYGGDGKPTGISLFKDGRGESEPVRVRIGTFTLYFFRLAQVEKGRKRPESGKLKSQTQISKKRLLASKPKSRKGTKIPKKSSQGEKIVAKHLQCKFTKLHNLPNVAEICLA